MDENNNQNIPHKFIFNNDFYTNLENVNSSLPPQRDMLAPVNQEPVGVVKTKEEVKPVVEELTDIKIDIPSIIPDTNNDTSVPKVEEPIINEPVISPTIEIPEIKVEEPISINNNIENDIDIEDPIVPETPIIENTPVEEVPQQINISEPVVEKNNTLEVNTGIDRNLENQVLNDIRKEKEPEFVYTPPVFEEPERKVYRAVRRPILNINDQKKEENNDEVVPIKHIEKVPDQMPQKIDTNWVPPYQPEPIKITEEINYYEEDEPVEIVKSNILEDLAKKEAETGRISILARYGDDFCSHDYITNPAIGRENEIKDLGLILLTPDKSAILVGKPGIGKTSIVEGLAYRLQRNQVPDALKGYTIISIKTASLLGSLPNGETRLQTLVDEIKNLDKIILFIDEVHMLMNASDGSNLDFANLFKESLGRGSIKMIGATTSEEYERYVLRDKAFVRRFQRVDVKEPTPDETVDIIMGTLPKIEANTGAKLKYTHYIQVEIMKYIVDITSEYKRVYGIG